MTRAPRLALATALLLIAAFPAHAQIDPDVNINVFITPADYAGCAAFDDAEVPLCQNLTSPPNAGPSFLWVVTSRDGGWPLGIGAIQFGIEWGGLELGGWTLCTGGHEIPQDGWPASGTGNAMTWTSACYEPPSEVAKIGYFSLTDGATGSMLITGDPRLDPAQALFIDCDNVFLFEICEGNLGAASLAVGTSPVCGDNCDGSTPIEETTWSQLKSHFD